MQLVNLQIFSDSYKISADNNAFLKKTLYPSRGLLYDRNDKLLVYNQPAYDVMVVMKETSTFDTLEFCQILNIPYPQFKKRLDDMKDRRLNPGYSPYTPQIFLTQLGNKEYGVLQESLYKFYGFYIQNRTARDYAFANAGHVLGYIAEADKRDIKQDEYYVQGDYVGKSGIERSYEQYLRGKKGVEILLRDAHGRIKGKYEDGLYDQAPASGKNLKLSIDMDLQAYGEELMRNKTGSIIIIEPSTGEVLCMVASPTYDPSLLVGRKFGDNYKLLLNHPNKPLIDRTMNARYPPGSTFKVAQGLVFLEEGIIEPSTHYTCNMGFPAGGGRPKCHPHASPLALVAAVATSCNAYFCWGMKAMLENRKKYSTIDEAFDRWKDLMVLQGFGYKLGIDLPGEKRGFIPNSQSYNNMYKHRWNAHTVISISIGQGEILSTPIQLCNLAAGIANRGHYYVPHVVKEIQDNDLDTLYTRPHYTGISSRHYDPIVEGMHRAVTGGTCRAANIPDIAVCGKTGTAENIGKDHSIFMGFAPMDDPKLAISVYIENGGFGATYAVPIGRLMIEKYLNGKISESSQWVEERIRSAIILPYGIQTN
ncbi:penicillin-binding protein 2 [Bacteroidales bacterium]|nr:penicillin-binding protein 2 [Bacteroidales bacterium]